MKRILAVASVLGVAVSAYAIPAPVAETEQNNTVATANFIGEALYPFGAVAIDGEIGAGTDATPAGIDFFAFDLRAGDFVAAAIYDVPPSSPSSNDSYLGIFNPAGMLFDTDDDDGPGLLSAYSFIVPTTGRWTFAVTGFGDADDGMLNGDGHEEAFTYKFVFAINPIPEPASLGLLAVGLMLGLRRR